MVSIDRATYPRFKKSVPPQELYDVFAPSPKEIEWAQHEHLLVLVVQLKPFQRLGYFPLLDKVPHVVADHVRSRPNLAADVACAHDSGTKHGPCSPSARRPGARARGGAALVAVGRGHRPGPGHVPARARWHGRGHCRVPGLGDVGTQFLRPPIPEPQ
ncbi:hypothetical protein GCM10009603_17510 [Nocardiopsis exhalans]